VGAEKMNRKADRWGLAGSGSKQGGETRGRGRALGYLLGWPRELGRPAAARASWAGWLLRASRPSQLRAFFPSFFPFSILFFFSFV